MIDKNFKPSDWANLFRLLSGNHKQLEKGWVKFVFEPENNFSLTTLRIIICKNGEKIEIDSNKRAKIKSWLLRVIQLLTTDEEWKKLVETYKIPKARLLKDESVKFIQKLITFYTTQTRFLQLGRLEGRSHYRVELSILIRFFRTFSGFLLRMNQYKPSGYVEWLIGAENIKPTEKYELDQYLRLLLLDKERKKGKYVSSIATYMEGLVNEHVINKGTEYVEGSFKKALIFLFETESNQIYNLIVRAEPEKSLVPKELLLFASNLKNLIILINRVKKAICLSIVLYFHNSPKNTNEQKFYSTEIVSFISSKFKLNELKPRDLFDLLRGFINSEPSELGSLFGYSKDYIDDLQQSLKTVLLNLISCEEEIVENYKNDPSFIFLNRKQALIKMQDCLRSLVVANKKNKGFA